MAKEAKYPVTITVTGRNVKKGICSNTNQCAIAQAVVESGFKAVMVGGGLEVGTKFDNVAEELVGDVLEFVLPARAKNFISRFDALEMADDEVLERKALAEKLSKKPLSITVKLTPTQAKKFLRKKAYQQFVATHSIAA